MIVTQNEMNACNTVSELIRRAMTEACNDPDAVDFFEWIQSDFERFIDVLEVQR